MLRALRLATEPPGQFKCLTVPKPSEPHAVALRLGPDGHGEVEPAESRGARVTHLGKRGGGDALVLEGGESTADEDAAVDRTAGLSA